MDSFSESQCGCGLNPPLQLLLPFVPIFTVATRLLNELLWKVHVPPTRGELLSVTTTEVFPVLLVGAMVPAASVPGVQLAVIDSPGIPAPLLSSMVNETL